MSHLKHLLIVGCLLQSVVGFSQAKDHYYILFSARFATFRPFSIGGHAFVTWRSESADLKKTTQNTFGFSAKKGMGLFRKVEGKVLEGYVKNSNNERSLRRFIIEVRREEFEATLKEVPIWKKEHYSLFNKNCAHFMNVIAAKAALITVSPRPCLFPKNPSKYIKRLKKANAIRIVKNPFLEKIRLRILRKVKVKGEKDADEA
jgi:hypothetical protein